MVDFTIIAGILTQLREWYSVFKGGANRKDDRYTEALKSLFSALTETKVYLARLARSEKQKRDYNTEAKLAQLWTIASVALRTFDNDLAERCFNKGNYWTNPDTWTRADIEKARIQIDAVLNDAKALL